MHRSRRVGRALGVAVALVTAAGMASCGSSGAASPSRLSFGAVLSLTGPGGVYGPQQKQAVELARDEINATRGVKGGRFEFTVVDDASDKAQAAQQTEKLISQNKVLALLGPTLSNSAVAAHPIAAHARTPMMGISNSGFNIVGPGCTYCDGWIFRDSVPEAAAIPLTLRTYVDAKHPKSIVLLYPNDDKFSVDGAATVKDAAARLGVQVGEIPFTKGETDLAPYVTKAVQARPEAIFITSLGGIPAKIMLAARQLGWTGDFLGGQGFNSAAVSKQAGEAGKGAQSASPWFIGNPFDANVAFVKAYRDRYHADPDQLAAQAYTGVYILADAARRAQLSGHLASDRARFKDALAATNIATPLGAFRFTADHDVQQTVYIVAMDGTGGYTLVASFPPSS
jgi:branched-chain amino acid transport system substrate-binding protein